MLILILLAGTIAVSASAHAQGNNYTQTNLVSSVPGLALRFDNDLLHPWGMAVSANQAFRISANQKGQFRSYDGSGVPQDPRAVIAVPAGSTVPASPTGVAANTTGLFIPAGNLSSPFLFATRQGTISAEYADDRGDIKTTTILVVDHGSEGAEYTSLAVLAPDCCAPYLAAADFRRALIDTFTSFFDPLGIPGAFTDPNLPTGYAPWTIQTIGDRVFVTYALQDAIQHDPVIGLGNGFVDIYNSDGSFARRFVSNGPLNVPSGVVRASANFGAFSNDILIGNYGDGAINAFDPNTGQFLGSLQDGNGNKLSDPLLHSMVFGDANGALDTLYLTAGLRGGNEGVFASIQVNTSDSGPDFTLVAPISNVTVTRGQAGTFSVTATPVGNFRSLFTFTCSAPTAVSCTVMPPSIDPITGAETVAVTAMESPVATSNPMAEIILPGIFFAAWSLRKRRGFSSLAILTFGALVTTVVCVTGCGSYGAGRMTPAPTTESFTITATAGSVSHTTVLTLNLE